VVQLARRLQQRVQDLLEVFDYRLWTSSAMIRWGNKGAVMRYSVFAWARGSTSTVNASAARVVQRNDNSGNPKFYFYAPVEGGQSDYGISIGVAVADNPEGPFEDARGIPLIFLADTAGTASHAWRNRDPAVFIDDNGRTYLYWGNGILYWAELEQDMIHLKGETYTTDSSGKMQNRSISGVQIHVIRDMNEYTAAPFLSKHDNLYYLTYESGSKERISYATSTSPEGPWQHQGVILDHVPNSTTADQSHFDFNGASYLTYH
jgi:beta-xylosidase